MKHKKLVTFVFSFIVLVGLCIGVFADADPNMFGYYTYSEPFNVGESYITVSNTESVLEPGEYYFHFHINELPSDYVELINNYDTGIVWYYENNYIRLYLTDFDNITGYYNFPIDGNDDVYIYVHQSNTVNGLHYSTFNSNGAYISTEIFHVSEFTTVDVYNNSLDVWTHVVSSVTTATNTVLDNDILLLFAAALPIISFGAGMLIRLFRKS